MINNTDILCQAISQEIAPAQTYELANYIYDHHPPAELDLSLSDISQRDSVWDSHRTQVFYVESIYNANLEFEKYAGRLFECSGWLKFGFNDSNGLVLKGANFCRVRYCPVCQWRKSLLWKALMYQSFPEIRQQYPTHRFIFLTLTIKNPRIGELRNTLDHMNKSWQRLIKRKEFAVVDGWIRTTEVARPKLPRKSKKDKIVYDPKTKNTHVHPHFHIILMVKPSYFGKGYLKQSDWVTLWRECLKVDYDPLVDVRTVKPKKGSHASDGTDNEENIIKGAIAETLKYATKPDEIILDCDNPESREWFYELTRQTHKLRFVATGGALKNAIKDEKKITNQELIQTGNDDETSPTDDRRLNFTYYRNKKKYVYNPTYNE